MLYRKAHRLILGTSGGANIVVTRLNAWTFGLWVGEDLA